MERAGLAEPMIDGRPTRRSTKAGNEMFPAVTNAPGLYAVRRRPMAASRTAPENSIRCIESR